MTDFVWTHKNTFAIGGLENVGYAYNQDMLIVLSSQEQGIFDCIKGEKIARQSNDFDWWDNLDEKTNSIAGFDRLANLEIKTHGLYGGDNLPKVTFDGWTLIVSEPEPDDKPFEKYLVTKIYLISPDKQQKHLVGKDELANLELLAFRKREILL